MRLHWMFTSIFPKPYSINYPKAIVLFSSQFVQCLSLFWNIRSFHKKIYNKKTIRSILNTKNMHFGNVDIVIYVPLVLKMLMHYKIFEILPFYVLIIEFFFSSLWYKIMLLHHVIFILFFIVEHVLFNTVSYHMLWQNCCWWWWWWKMFRYKGIFFAVWIVGDRCIIINTFNKISGSMSDEILLNLKICYWNVMFFYYSVKSFIIYDNGAKIA